MREPVRWLFYEIIIILRLLLSGTHAQQQHVSRIEIVVKTSECPNSGTDSLILFYLGTLSKETGKLVHVSGPHIIESFDRKLEPGTVDTAEYPFPYEDRMSTVRCFAAKPADPIMCIPGADIIFIEKRTFSPLINEPSSVWKPSYIQVATTFFESNGTKHERKISHDLPQDCGQGWIDSNGFYQIGPNGEYFARLSEVRPPEMIVDYQRPRSQSLIQQLNYGAITAPPQRLIRPPPRYQTPEPNDNDDNLVPVSIPHY